MPDGADDLAALGFNIIRCIVLERVAESIIRGDEEPTVAAILDQRAAGADRECVRVIGPVEAIGRALLAGEIRRRGAVEMVIFFFSFDSCCTASATDEVVSSMMASTFSTSYQRRAMPMATSGLFW